MEKFILDLNGSKYTEILRRDIGRETMYLMKKINGDDNGKHLIVWVPIKGKPYASPTELSTRAPEKIKEIFSKAESKEHLEELINSLPPAQS